MELTKTQTVSISMMGTDAHLSMPGIFRVIQDAITDLMGMHKIDGNTVKREYNALWVFVKTRAKFMKNLVWGTEFTVNAFFSYVSLAKINVDVHITSNGEPVMFSRTEICALDITTQKIRRTNTVGVDPGMLSSRPIEELPFTKFENIEPPIVDSVKIKSTNIDFSHHTNNSEYVRLIMDSYSVAEIEAMDIKEMELVYAGQSYENDVLDIRKAKFDDKHLIVLEKNGAPIIKCEIIAANK